MILRTEKSIWLMMLSKNTQILMESMKWEINFLIVIFKGIWKRIKKFQKMLCMDKSCHKWKKLLHFVLRLLICSLTLLNFRITLKFLDSISCLILNWNLGLFKSTQILVWSLDVPFCKGSFQTCFKMRLELQLILYFHHPQLFP